MPRSDKKNCICRDCGYKFTRPAKLRQHYKSNKNQCGPDPEIIIQEMQASAPETSSQKERPSVIERQDTQKKPKVINQTPDPEGGPDPSIQAHKEGQPETQLIHNGEINDLLKELNKIPEEELQNICDEEVFTGFQAEKEYASGKHFRSIYEEKDRTYSTGEYSTKIVQEEPPDGDIIFLERERDPAR